MSLGSRINDIRKAKDISIDELSALSGVPKGTLSKITAGITTKPTIDTVKAIARALDCGLDDLDDKPALTKTIVDLSPVQELEDLVHQLTPTQAAFMVRLVEHLLALNPDAYAAACAESRNLWKG